jgi:hypothetical protein
VISWFQAFAFKWVNLCRYAAVSIPVRRVKPDFDVENETYGWDEEPVQYDDNAWDKAA